MSQLTDRINQNQKTLEMMLSGIQDKIGDWKNKDAFQEDIQNFLQPYCDLIETLREDLNNLRNEEKQTQIVSDDIEAWGEFLCFNDLSPTQSGFFLIRPQNNIYDFECDYHFLNEIFGDNPSNNYWCWVKFKNPAQGEEWFLKARPYLCETQQSHMYIGADKIYAFVELPLGHGDYVMIPTVQSKK